MVILIVADGARPDTVRSLIDAGELPALARIRAEGGASTLTTVFPSVTGPAYTPFLMGRFPGPVGLPGLRWYDRTRSTCSFPDYARSYVGAELRHLAGDIDRAAPTLFELAGRSIASMSMLTRGLRRSQRLDSGTRFMARTMQTHFRGDVRGWLDIDRELSERFATRVRDERPHFAIAAFMGSDKVSHAEGHDGPLVREALQIVDHTAAQLLDDAERGGYWRDLHLWVVSDHGHSPVDRHDELAAWLRRLGHRVRAHPWVYGPGDVAVMVSGNAMAHVYLELARQERPWWRALRGRWEDTVQALVARPAVDFVVLPLSPAACEIRTFGRGRALIERCRGRYRYACLTGDPLGLGDTPLLDATEAHALTFESRYPDALVQLSWLASSPRAGDVIVSAAPGWDLRAQYEPIPHISTHGSLHREHMLVPFLHSRPTLRPPARTTELMPSALVALRLQRPVRLDGSSFL